MTPYLILARIPGLGPTQEGAMTLFAAMFATEEEAIAAVKIGGPAGAVIEGVIGTATEGLVKALKLKAGTAVNL